MVGLALRAAPEHDSAAVLSRFAFAGEVAANGARLLREPLGIVLGGGRWVVVAPILLAVLWVLSCASSGCAPSSVNERYGDFSPTALHI